MDVVIVLLKNVVLFYLFKLWLDILFELTHCKNRDIKDLLYEMDTKFGEHKRLDVNFNPNSPW